MFLTRFHTFLMLLRCVASFSQSFVLPSFMRTQIRTFILLFNAYLGPLGPHGALGPAKSWAPWAPWALGPAKSWAPWAPWGLGPAKSWAPWAHGALGPAWGPQLAAWARPGALSRRRGPGLGPSAGGAGPGPAWGPQSIRRNPHQKNKIFEFFG